MDASWVSSGGATRCSRRIFFIIPAPHVTEHAVASQSAHSQNHVSLHCSQECTSAATPLHGSPSGEGAVLIFRVRCIHPPHWLHGPQSVHMDQAQSCDAKPHACKLHSLVSETLPAQGPTTPGFSIYRSLRLWPDEQVAEHDDHSFQTDNRQPVCTLVKMQVPH